MHQVSTDALFSLVVLGSFNLRLLSFNLRPVSTGLVALIWKRLNYEINEMLFLCLNNLKVFLLHNHKRGLCNKKLASFSIKLHDDATVKKPILLLYNNKWTRRLSMLAAIFCYV